MTETKTLLTHQQVEEALKQHTVWLSSRQQDGAQADFSNKIISGYNFSGRSLISSTFYNAHVYKCNFEGADLSDASFIAAEVGRCNFRNANLTGTDFSWGELKGCDLDGSKHLTVKALKRANLKASALPSSTLFDGVIDYTNNLIKKSRNTLGITLGFSITMLLVLLFGKSEHSGSFAMSLPLILAKIELACWVGLILILFVLTFLGCFYSLSLSAIKKQINKIPATFPDGRYTHETVFPWFWVTWVSEIWQTDYSEADRSAKHLLWSRLFIFSTISNIFFVTIFITFLFLIRQFTPLYFFLTDYVCISGVITMLLFGLTISVAYSLRGKFYAYCAGMGAIATWSAIYFLTDYKHTMIVAFAMIIAWWWDTLTYSNEPFDLDMSVPEANFHSKRLQAIRDYVQPRFHAMNVASGLLFCLLAALYLFTFKPYGF